MPEHLRAVRDEGCLRQLFPPGAQVDTLDFADSCPRSALLGHHTPASVVFPPILWVSKGGSASPGRATSPGSPTFRVSVRDAIPWQQPPGRPNGDKALPRVLGAALLKITSSKAERNRNVYANRTISTELTMASWSFKSGQARTDCQTNCHL